MVRPILTVKTVRSRRKIALVMLVVLWAACSQAFSQATVVQYLSGTDKDHTVQWDFYCTTGSKSGKWDKIAVPSNWELQGFGTYNYYRDDVNPDEQGLYKHAFQVPAGKNKRVFIVFEASMTDTEVKVNGQLAGPVHQGGFYRFKYEITSLLKPAGTDNLLEVKVSKRSANASINQAERKADFWQFGGIFRPVYLEIVPATYIDRVALNAQADGSLSVDVYAVNAANQTLKAEVQELSGKRVGSGFSAKTSSGQEKTTLRQQFKGIKPWNPEAPKLYNLIVSLADAKGAVHRIKQRFGFRTMELRPQDGLYVNGQKIYFKGVCRHSEWPESGRTLSKQLSLLDVGLMKEMNMNAVRMSHYPPDQHFLDVCDSLGLFVLDELTGWQAKYDTLVGRKLVKELVVRDVNHPSIVLWDNGNEGGFNFGLDADYALYDPQKRPVIHPWERFNGTDTKHYPDYNYVQNSVLYGKEIFFPTEFMHGLFDGGHGAGLEDFWNLMRRHPYFGGGFLWALHDEAVVRTDQNGKLDAAGDQAPDGILGPHREKEASFFTIKELWSPVVIDKKFLAPGFDGRLEVENRYLYTDLNQCSFAWRLVSFPAPNSTTTAPKNNATGTAQPPALAPGTKGTLALKLPSNWHQSDALYLTAYGPDKRELFTWTMPIRYPQDIDKQFVAKSAAPAIEATEQVVSLLVKADGVSYYFDKSTGYLQKVVNAKGEISLSGGPVQAGVHHSLQKFRHYAAGDSHVVEADYGGPSEFHVKWLFAAGKPAKLEYQYSQKGDADFMGITFNYPEEKITGMKWLGRGPYRVWKNRLKGQQFGVWHKDYNNSITGETWQYPEFKGYHADLYWVVVENKESPFTVYSDDQSIFLQMLKPARPAGARTDNTVPAFPDGNLGFLTAIAPIGTKFQAAALMGPQSQKNFMLNYTPIKGSLWFDFR
ncbi:glycoside hydrolase family 2 TIM barrel-domain containing protein [Hymenobacter jejuensis]|uniref:beta-galactosidase n=1 Tax=Hymenobacter jejuensis TaxID=2502781 RepID=A0A5B7ZVB4_9BACT|nr:glycoside hydrolase family 2 TIM barrel-domain containing protein [Hymenobacter jejuensis]QDA58930.1 glycoside hydrolase family 2 [Hymenobacter jejuensis]